MKTSLLLLLLVACGQPTDKLDEIGQAVCQPDQPPPCCPSCCNSPVLVDSGGNGLHLTSAIDGVSFALNPGQANQWSWTEAGSDDAFLGIDLNGDGEITDGTELFGDNSQQVSSASPNGFLAMSWYDMPIHGGNGDGTLDALDDVWTRLVLWTDSDHDGWSAPSEMAPVSSAVLSFNLNYKRSTEVDANGNEYKYRSTLVPAPGSTTSIVVTDAWLHTTPANTAPATCQTEVRCTAWVYIPIGNPFGLPCSSNPGGHGVPTFTFVNAANGQSYQVELFAQTIIETLTDASGNTPELRREMTQDVRASTLALIINQNIGCATAPYPTPDPYKTPTEPTTSPLPGNSGHFSAACSSRLKCGGCGG